MYLAKQNYRLPILISLNDRTSATPDEVAQDVYNMIGDSFTYQDVTRVTKGHASEVTWRNRLRWVKADLAKEGLVSSENNKWVLTNKGKKELKKWVSLA